MVSEEAVMEGTAVVNVLSWISATLKHAADATLTYTTAFADT